MMSSTVTVRPATSEDIADLVGFSAEVRDSPAVRRRSAAGSTSLEQRYAALLGDADRQVLVAVGPDEQTVGMVVLAHDWTGELLDVPAVHASHLVVADSHRRRGVGRQLLAAAASYAEEMGCEHVLTGVATTSREVNRYFARLGFAPVVTRRVATVSTLRRNLSVSEAAPGEGASQGARRRAVRITGSLAAGLGRRPERAALRGAH